MNLTMKRLCAYVIDMGAAILLLSIFMFSYQVFLLEPETASKAGYMLLCAFLSICFLFIYLPTKENGQTLGKVIFHIRVINEDGKQRTWFQNFLRECVLKFSFVMVLIPMDVIYTLMESIRQRKIVIVMAHDALLKTSVC